MVVDSSALIAIWQREPAWRSLRDAALGADTCVMSSASFVETMMVVEARRGPQGGQEMRAVMRNLQIAALSFDQDQAEIACDAFRRFGRGRHRAGLNLGDCFAYALAKQRGEPLLFKGDDFLHTDIEPALRP